MTLNSTLFNTAQWLLVAYHHGYSACFVSLLLGYLQPQNDDKAVISPQPASRQLDTWSWLQRKTISGTIRHIKLAMETQINTAWFDSAWPKVLMETPRKTRSHCLLTKRTVWHFLAGFSCWFYLSISRHLKPFGSKFRLKNQHTAYIVHRDIVVKMIGQWEWYPLGLSHAVFLSLLGHKALFSFSPYLSQTDWGHIAIILFVNKWVDLFFLSLSRDVHTNTQWVTFTLLCPAGFFFPDVLTTQQKTHYSVLLPHHCASPSPAIWSALASDSLGSSCRPSRQDWEQR